MNYYPVLLLLLSAGPTESVRLRRAQTGVELAFALPICEQVGQYLNPACWLARYVSAAQQDAFPELMSVSQALRTTTDNEAVAKRYLDALPTLQTNPVLAPAVSAAVTDLRTAIAQAVSQFNLGQSMSTTTVARMVADLGSAFNGTYSTVYNTIAGAANALRALEVNNLNIFIRKANLLNGNSMSTSWLNGLAAAVAASPATLDNDASTVKAKAVKIHDQMTALPNQIGLLAAGYATSIQNRSNVFNVNAGKIFASLQNITSVNYIATLARVVTAALAQQGPVNSSLNGSFADLNRTIAQQLSDALSGIQYAKSQYSSLNASLIANASGTMGGIDLMRSVSGANTTTINRALQYAIGNITSVVRDSLTGKTDAWGARGDARLGNLTDLLNQAKVGIVNAVSGNGTNSAVMTAILAAMSQVNTVQQSLNNKFANTSQANINAYNDMIGQLSNSSSRFAQIFSQMGTLRTALEREKTANITNGTTLNMTAAALGTLQAPLDRVSRAVTEVANNATRLVASAGRNSTLLILADSDASRAVVKTFNSRLQNLTATMRYQMVQANAQLDGYEVQQPRNSARIVALGQAPLDRNRNTEASLTGVGTQADAVVATSLATIASRKSEIMGRIATVQSGLNASLATAVGGTGGVTQATEAALDRLLDFHSSTNATSETSVQSLWDAVNAVSALSQQLQTRSSNVFDQVAAIMAANASVEAQQAPMSAVVAKVGSDLDLYESGGGFRLPAANSDIQALIASDPAMDGSNVAAADRDIRSRISQRQLDLGSVQAGLQSLNNSLTGQIERFNVSAGNSVNLITDLLASARNMVAALGEENDASRSNVADLEASMNDLISGVDANLTRSGPLLLNRSANVTAAPLASWRTQLDALVAVLLAASVDADGGNQTAALAALDNRIAGGQAAAVNLNSQLNTSVVTGLLTNEQLMNSLGVTLTDIENQITNHSADPTGNLTALQMSLSDLANAVSNSSSGTADALQNISAHAADSMAASSGTNAGNFAQAKADADAALAAATGSVNEGLAAANGLGDLVAANHAARVDSTSAVINSIGAGSWSIHAMLQAAVQEAASSSASVSGSPTGNSSTTTDLIRQLEPEQKAWDAYKSAYMTKLRMTASEEHKGVDTMVTGVRGSVREASKITQDGITALRAVLDSVGSKEDDLQDRMDQLVSGKAAFDDAMVATPPIETSAASFSVDDILKLNLPSATIAGVTAQAQTDFAVSDANVASMIQSALSPPTDALADGNPASRMQGLVR